MLGIIKNWRTPLSLFISAALLVGAYVLARSVESPSNAEASTETALLQAIAARDSDADGLPDWEETLYGTSPNIIDSFHLGMTDGMAVARGLIVPKAVADVSVATSTFGTSTWVDKSLPPAPADDTLTAAFSKDFLATYLAAKQANGGADLSQSDVTNIANQLLNSLSTSVVPVPDFKSAKDITVSGSGKDTLAAFAVSAEAVLVKNTANATTSELNYLKSALQNNDATAFPHIASIAKGYRDSAIGLAVLPVPRELAATDLALINALMRISEIATDFTRVNTDPLATMLALYQYPQAVSALGTAFIRIGEIYQSAGVFLPAGTPGASFVNLIADVVADQRAAAVKP